jgi:hypothetical protein
MVKNRQVEMFRKQPITGFFLWNDLIVQARYSVEVFRVAVVVT